MPDQDAAFYRQRAKDMRTQAGRADNRALQDSYFAIAADWDRLAKEMEQRIKPAPAKDAEH